MLNKYFKLLNIASVLCFALNPFMAMAQANCAGANQLPEQFQDRFSEVDDLQLVQKAIGKPDEGKLCQGKAYVVTEDTIVHRAWNSTNPKSELGNWWALSAPRGNISKYRQDYEICYQWSPLDRLSTCMLKAGTKVVIGTGQSAKCSQYLTHQASKMQQVYIDQPNSDVLMHCIKSISTFNWKAYEETNDQEIKDSQ